MIATRAAALFLLLILLATITACQPRTVHEKPPANAKEAVQQAIDEANVAIAAAATTLNDAYKAGAVTWSEFKDSRDVLNQAASYRDQASVLLLAGDPTTAQGQLKLANSLLGLVQKRLIAIKNGANP
jgi:biopolymer transport protein ExbD